MIENNKEKKPPNNETLKLKKMIKNLQLALTVISIMAVIAMSMFGLYLTKYNSLKNNTTFGNRMVTIVTKLPDKSQPFYKTYSTTAKEKTLADLMSDYPKDFALQAMGGTLGKYVKRIDQVTANNQQFWQATSKTYIEHYPNAKAAPFPGGPVNSLSYGASFINLNHDETFLYILTPFKS